MFFKLPVTVVCLAQVPQLTKAAGVSRGIPLRPKVSTMEPRAARPMSTTRVPPFLAKTSQGTNESGLVGSSLPLTTVKAVAMPRWVMGMPA